MMRNHVLGQPLERRQTVPIETECVWMDAMHTVVSVGTQKCIHERGEETEDNPGYVHGRCSKEKEDMKSKGAQRKEEHTKMRFH
tara:strand:- start:199 stop:450 length:252 start_codon:yes stop_codon:yes gene_type:complete